MQSLQKPSKINKIVAVVGPTSSGKSALGVFLAKKFNGEIISVDSRQVYWGMDIGTGKITKKEMSGIPHHLLSFANPKGKSLNVAVFKKLADKKIREIQQRGHLPILVGGTGFWIDAITSGQVFPDAPVNPTLRKELYKKSAPQLFTMLLKLDSTRAENIDQHNKVRLIRAIEIAKFNKASKATKLKTRKNTKSDKVKPTQPEYQTLFIGTDMPTEELYEKIEKRLDQRIKQGMVKEVRRLHANGVSWKKLESYGLEYRFIAEFLQDKILGSNSKPDQSKMRELLLYAIKHYAKRQRTWFKRNTNINWVNPLESKYLKTSEKLVKDFIKDYK